MSISLRKALSGVAAFAAVSVFLAFQAAVPAQAEGKISVQWLGHAAFEVTSPGGTKLLIDPFIMNNPKTPKALKDLSLYKPDVILLTHMHGDHVGDAVAIHELTGVKILGVSDDMRSLKKKDGTPLDPNKEVIRGNPGGKVKIKDVVVHFVPALHSSKPSGRPVGYVIEFSDGRKLYHSGDTDIFGDMSLIQEIHKPNIILFQAGGGPFNQAPEIAKLAIKKYFKPDVIIPMHYGTWGILSSEAEVQKVLGGDPRVKMMQPGQTLKF
jgi:L-ascorbate metabolism protein UlaG (beta-lactamase superfamily)